MPGCRDGEGTPKGPGSHETVRGESLCASQLSMGLLVFTFCLGRISFSLHSLLGELVVMSGDRDVAGVNELRTVSMSGNKDSALLFGEGI